MFFINNPSPENPKTNNNSSLHSLQQIYRMTEFFVGHSCIEIVIINEFELKKDVINWWFHMHIEIVEKGNSEFKAQCIVWLNPNSKYWYVKIICWNLHLAWIFLCWMMII